MNLLALAYQFQPWEALVRLSLGDGSSIPATASTFAGACLLYPGTGKVVAIHGLDEARTMPGVYEVKCHAKPGDQISERLGTGQMKGHVLATGETMEQCKDRVSQAAKMVRFDVEARTL